MTSIPSTLPRTGSRRRRNLWSSAPGYIGLVIILFWIFAAMTSQFWAPYPSLDMVGHRLQPPSYSHLFGTDSLGRDVFSRTMAGASYSIPIATTVVVAGALFGSALGAIAGFFGGWTNTLIMRMVDITLSFPPMLLAMAVAASLGPGLWTATLAMIGVWWPLYARLMQAQVISVKHMEHVDAAISSGVRPRRLLTRYILPLCWTPILINATMDFGQVVLLAASLSFIGLGAAPPAPEWGAMVSDGAVNYYYWWIATAPGLAILTVVLALNFIGDRVRDILDPRKGS
ncbi:peptide ABC transporter permease [Mesorhizobium sp. LSJC255A00]|uniref:ABC transporter permease n=1 Tax=Mesorhizobium sp. LSJC255A00 TaxID=1287313 RepID=UPI0003CDE27A|nr:ABC transporter permease [Mesorhizobium sp. LSJC255A00]ESX20147.1 peptide ABC transporter permease [Mesorhizobium sp. LSJC255A00]